MGKSSWTGKSTSQIKVLKVRFHSSEEFGINGIWNCCCSVTKSCPTLCDPWTAAHQASLSFTISLRLLKLMSTELVMPFKHLTLCHSLLLLPAIFPNIRVFSSKLTLHIRWPEYWSFSFNISPPSEYSRLISFKIDWLALLSSPRDSQETSPAPQFKGINSLTLSLSYCPALTSIHNYWKKHSCDCTDLCRQSNVSAF